MEAPTSTFQLLEKAKAGDQRALSDAFERSRRRLAVLVHFKLGRQARQSFDVDDIVQEVHLRAFRDIQRFSYHSPGAFLRWLSTIAGHVIIDQIRYQNRSRRQAEYVPLSGEPRDSVTPSRLFAQEQALQGLLAKLEALPEPYRDALILAKIEGLTTAEIAERLGKSRPAVALLVFRAIQRFRALQEDATP